MKASPEFDVLADLVWALANDRLDRQGEARLQQLLDSEAANRRVYIELMDQFAALEWEKGERAAPNDECGTMNGELPADTAPKGAAAPTNHPSFILHHSLLFAYAVASLMLGIGLWTSWVWDTSGSRAVVRTVPQAIVPPAKVGVAGQGSDQDAGQEVGAVAQVTAMADCRWADPRTAARDQEKFGPGRKFALTSGLLKITYRVGTMVILEGPAVYEVGSVSSGTLGFGKLTVIVGKGAPASMPAVTPAWTSPFSVRTPTALVDVRSQPGNFGMEVDRAGISWVHAFTGRLALAITGRETGRVQTVPLGEGQLARIEKRAAGLLVTCKDGAACPEMFAHFTIQPAEALANGGQWLKELRADPGVPLMAVGSEPEPDWGRQPATDWTLGKGTPSGTGSASGTPGGTGSASGASRGGVIDTCRATVTISDMVPATVALRGRFVAGNHVTAMRINGKTLEGPRQIDEDAVRQSGVFAIHGGFVAGENVWEIDVNNTPPRSSLVVYAQLSGIRPARPAASAEAFRRSNGQEKTTEVR